MGRIEVSETTKMFKNEANMKLLLYEIVGAISFSVSEYIIVLVKVLFGIEIVRLYHSSKCLRVKET